MPALIVAPDAGFDSYVSVATADSYMSNVGKDDWVALDQTTKEVNLRKGSQYIGSRRLIAAAIDPAVLPQVVAATCEAAYLAWKGLLYPSVVAAQAVKSVKVGPIERTYADPVNGGMPSFPMIDDLLYGLMARNAYGTVYLDRA